MRHHPHSARQVAHAAPTLKLLATLAATTIAIHLAACSENSGLSEAPLVLKVDGQKLSHSMMLGTKGFSGTVQASEHDFTSEELGKLVMPNEPIDAAWSVIGPNGVFVVFAKSMPVTVKAGSETKTINSGRLALVRANNGKLEILEKSP